MLIKGHHQIKVPMFLNLILMLVYVTTSVNGLESRKLGDTTVPATNGSTDEKCTPCGGGGSYAPPPPPPALPPPSPPPPSPKKLPPSQYNCPPPPSSFTYITGPPGNLYPVDENFSGASCRHRRSFAAAAVLVCLMSMIAFW